MNKDEITVIGNLVISLIGQIPNLIQMVKNWKGDAATKEALLARIKAAQESIPEWV